MLIIYLGCDGRKEALIVGEAERQLIKECALKPLATIRGWSSVLLQTWRDSLEHSSEFSTAGERDTDFSILCYAGLHPEAVSVVHCSLVTAMN